MKRWSLNARSEEQSGCSPSGVTVQELSTRAVKGKPVTRMSGYLPLWAEEESGRRKKVCALDGRSEEHHNHPPPSIEWRRDERTA